MSAPLPDPMTPPDCDLRGYEFMPLFGSRLFGSEFDAQASDLEFRVAIRILWAAWLQCPAGSLPTDDGALCRLADLGRDLKTWKKIRPMVLRHFTLCSDGRLYHPLLCIEAKIAFEKRRKDRERKAIIREGCDWEALRQEVFIRDGHTCGYCGVRNVPLACDHVVSVSRGGRSTLENLIAACVPCNTSKGAKSLSEWRSA